MKALKFHQTGDLANLKMEEVPVPEPQDGELLVQVKAFAINPSDIKNILGNMKGLTTLPRIPGRDFAGIVAKGGGREGQAVFGSAPVGFDRDGVQAEFVVVPEQAVVLKPDSLSFEMCAAFGIPYITAWIACIEEGATQANDTVLIMGVNGAVGSVAAEIAKWKGAHVLGAVRRIGGAHQSSAVDHFIDLEKDELSQAVMQNTGQKGANVVLDTVGGSLFEQCVKSLAEKGRHIVIAAQEPQVTFNLLGFYRRQGRIIGVNTLLTSAKESAASLQKVIALVSEGHLQAPKPKIFKWDQALDVYQQIQGGTLKGKAVISMS